MSEITKIELNFTLEGEDAVAVLRAILGAKAEVKSDVATKAVSPVEPKKTEVPEKKQDKRKKKGAGSRFLIAPWSDSELDYLSALQEDYYNSNEISTFRLADRKSVEQEFESLTGTKRSLKALNVRISIMRGRDDTRFFPEGKKRRKKRKDKKS